MRKKVKTFFAVNFAIVTSLFIVFMILFSWFVFTTPKVDFDINKIKFSQTNLMLFDNKKLPIKEDTKAVCFVKLNTLPSYLKQCFLSIEDKEFYNHSGLNYKRMIKAMLKNITSLKIKEGASTISQQLIKNTHLTNERTFSRKINEIILTKQLENKMSKDEILEYYLNVIYFGDNCYGIENASMHYFSKPAKNLTITECATLAGIIKSPNTYSPIKNKEKCKQRRNLVLSQLHKDGVIDFETFINLTSTDLVTNITEKKDTFHNSYSQACYDEAMAILKMPQKQIAIGEYKIYTYLDTEKQSSLTDIAMSYNLPYDMSIISMNQHGEIEGYFAKSNLKLFDVKRQPGSTLKPILVYGPALDKNIISPATQINDEKLNINGYAPQNVSNKYYGYTSVRDCVSKSLNIPAVKTLGYVGLTDAKKYASKCNIKFDEMDNNLSLALGGMTHGTTLKEITNSYTPLLNNGNFVEAKFISYIADKNNKIIYTNPHNQTRVFREDTSYLMTDILKDCVKNGTAKKLNTLNFPIASKTGTVGQKYNTDAWNISYTPKNIVGVWIGNVDNSSIENIVGGGLPTEIARDYQNKINSDSSLDFDKPTSVYTEKIDLLSLQNNHEVIKANNFIPEKYIITELFSVFNQPKDKSTNFIEVSPVILDGYIKNNKACLFFEAKDYLIYEIYSINKNNDSLLSVIANRTGKIYQEFDIKNSEINKYYVVTKIKNYADNSEVISDKSNILELYNNKNSKWYIS